MREYTIALPMRSNSGADYNLERERFEREAIRLTGGITREGGPACGSWRDHEGNLYREPMQGYRVAASHKDWVFLLDVAKHMFPDQIAFYWVEGGTVHFHKGAAA